MEPENLIFLVNKAQAGDVEAQQTLYQDSVRSVYFLALQIMRNHADAEDITQEVFLSVFEKLHQLRDPGSYYHWLNHIAANKCTSALRKKRDILGGEQDEAERFDAVEEDILLLPEPSLDIAESCRMILQVVQNLPDTQRLCVLYHYYQQLSVVQIAMIMECSEGTVKSRLSAARAKIKAELERKNREEGIKLYAVPFMLGPILWRAASDIVLPQTASVGILGKLALNHAVQAQNIHTSAASAANTSQATYSNASGAGKAAASGLKMKTMLAISGAVLVAATGTGIYLSQRDHSSPTPTVLESSVQEVSESGYRMSSFTGEMGGDIIVGLGGISIQFDGNMEEDISLSDIVNVSLTRDGVSVPVQFQGEVSREYQPQTPEGIILEQTHYSAGFAQALSQPGHYILTYTLWGEEHTVVGGEEIGMAVVDGQLPEMMEQNPQQRADQGEQQEQNMIFHGSISEQGNTSGAFIYLSPSSNGGINYVIHEYVGEPLNIMFEQYSSTEGNYSDHMTLLLDRVDMRNAQFDPETGVAELVADGHIELMVNGNSLTYHVYGDDFDFTLTLARITPEEAQRLTAQ